MYGYGVPGMNQQTHGLTCTPCYGSRRRRAFWTRGIVAKTPRPASQYDSLCQRQVKATDQEIDALVYELYGLTGEEIAIVEEASR